MSISPSREADEHNCHLNLFIGQDVKGRWIVQDRDGRKGGVFISLPAAIRFAKSEGDKHPLPVSRFRAHDYFASNLAQQKSRKSASWLPWSRGIR